MPVTVIDRVEEALGKLGGQAKNSDVIAQVLRDAPETNLLSLRNEVSRAKRDHTDRFLDLGRGRIGLRAAADPSDEVTVEEAPPEVRAEKAREETLYEPVKEFFLTNESATRIEILGGKLLSKRWGNPDLFGVTRPLPSSAYKFAEEFVAVEVKRDTKDLVTAFGQAAAYLLFAHRSYLVVPDAKTEDFSRVDALCERMGIGLVTFSENGGGGRYSFSEILRPRRAEPDSYYLDEYLQRMRYDHVDAFNAIMS